ncbi:hypothetical protein LY76DRAFT_342157 [Colletotrichum caudatum]|nr:hypothetical protein LY76DRAFT_342157 [Colletotrichum caudatum]
MCLYDLHASSHPGQTLGDPVLSCPAPPSTVAQYSLPVHLADGCESQAGTGTGTGTGEPDPSLEGRAYRIAFPPWPLSPRVPSVALSVSPNLPPPVRCLARLRDQHSSTLSFSDGRRRVRLLNIFVTHLSEWPLVQAPGTRREGDSCYFSDSVPDVSLQG